MTCLSIIDCAQSCTIVPEIRCVIVFHGLHDLHQALAMSWHVAKYIKEINFSIDLGMSLEGLCSSAPDGFLC